MFGLNKLKELKDKAEETKARLDSVLVEGESAAGKIKVVSNANRKIQSIDIDQSVLNVWSKDDVQSAVIEAVNHALTQAESVAEAEMKSLMPNIPGLGL